jgi:hypothetical protein
VGECNYVLWPQEMTCASETEVVKESKVARRLAVSSIGWLDVWRAFGNGNQTTLVPCPWDVIEPVKLVAAMINPGARHRADATGEVELLRLQRIVQVPLSLKSFQLRAGCDANPSALGKLDRVWSSCLAHRGVPPSNEDLSDVGRGRASLEVKVSKLSEM